MNYETIKLSERDGIWQVQIHRPRANNTINGALVRELNAVLTACEDQATVVVLSGLPEVFCFGADFSELASGVADVEAGPEPLYALWLRLATGPFVTVANVRGKTNAGGVGFVAACDIVLSDETAVFSLSELLFGLYPACVLPFLMRRVGFQKAHFMTLSTQPINAQQARDWGLVDVLDGDGELLLRRQLQRLRRLSKPAIQRYKAYASRIGPSLAACAEPAVAANLEMFSDAGNLRGIRRYVEQRLFPWE